MAVVADVRVDDVDVDDEISSSDVAIDADVDVMPMPLDMLDAEPEMKNESFPIFKIDFRLCIHNTSLSS